MSEFDRLKTQKDAMLAAEWERDPRTVALRAELKTAQRIIGNLLGERETVAAQLRRIGSANDTPKQVLEARGWYLDHRPERPAALRDCECWIQPTFGASKLPNYGTIDLVVDGSLQTCCRRCRRPLVGYSLPAKKSRTRECPFCRGEGRISTGEECPECRGSGCGKPAENER